MGIVCRGGSPFAATFAVVLGITKNRLKKEA